MNIKRSKHMTAGLALLLGATMISGAALASEDSEVRDVAEFEKVVVEGAMDITITASEKQRVEVSAESRYLSRVETTVRNKTLYISQEGGRWRDADVEITISVRNLNGFIIDGAADAEIRGLDTDSFVLEIDGAGDVYLEGSCDDAKYEINGAGDIDAMDFKCKDVEVVINGAGDTDVYASQSIRAELNGVGDITVCGDPKSVRPSIRGLGSFDLDDC